MKVDILNDIFECNNIKEEVDEILKKINEIIAESKLVLNYIVVDGIEVYNDYYQNIVNNIDTIESISIILKNTEETIYEVLESNYNYLERVLPQLQELADAFYQDDGKKIWGEFTDFLEGLESIIKTISFLVINPKKYSNIERYKIIDENLTKIVEELKDAMEKDDRVCISDLIIYEIEPILNDVFNEFKCTLNSITE